MSELKNRGKDCVPNQRRNHFLSVQAPGEEIEPIGDTASFIRHNSHLAGSCVVKGLRELIKIKYVDIDSDWAAIANSDR